MALGIDLSIILILVIIFREIRAVKELTEFLDKRMEFLMPAAWEYWKKDLDAQISEAWASDPEAQAYLYSIYEWAWKEHYFRCTPPQNAIAMELNKWHNEK